MSARDRGSPAEVFDSFKILNSTSVLTLGSFPLMETSIEDVAKRRQFT